MSITSIKLHCRIKKRPDCYFLYTGGRAGFWNGVTQKITYFSIQYTDWSDYTITYTTNPYTSSAWEEGELEELSIRVEIAGDNRSNYKYGSYWTWAYAEVVLSDGSSRYYYPASTTQNSGMQNNWGAGSSSIHEGMSDIDESDNAKYIYWLGTTAGTTWQVASFTVKQTSSIYPTEDVRVSGLVHRYNRDEARAYTLEVLLGGFESNFAVAEARLQAVVEQIQQRKFFEGTVTGKVPEPRITPAYGGTMEITGFTPGYTTAAKFKADLIAIMEKRLEEDITDQERAVIVRELEKLQE